MREPLRRVAAAAFLAALTVGLPACGGGGGSSSSPSTLPPAPVRRQVAAFNFVTASTIDIGRGEFTTTATGTLDATCDWTFAFNDLDIGIYKGSCSFSQFLGGQCPILVESTSTTAKPEKVSAANAPAGTYTLIIANIGSTAEAGTCQVFLTN